MDNNLNYQQARRIRGAGISKILADQLDQNQTVAGALGRTVSLKLQSRMKGVQEKFDPLNVAKFLTFGSSWAPALLGHLTGRSHADTRYFAGRLKPVVVKGTKVTPTPKDGEQLVEGKNVRVKGINQQLIKIYKLLDKSIESEKKRRELEHNFDEEKSQEAARRHKEFMKVLTAITGGDTSAVEVDLGEKKSPLETVADMASNLGWLSRIGSISALALEIAPLIIAGYAFNEWWTKHQQEKSEENVQSARSAGGDVAADAAAQLEQMRKSGEDQDPMNDEKVKTLVQIRDDAIKRRDIFREEFYRSNGYRKKGDKFVDSKGNAPSAELASVAEDHVKSQIDAMNAGEIKDPIGKIDQNMAKKFQADKKAKAVSPTPTATATPEPQVSSVGGGRGGQGVATAEQVAQNVVMPSTTAAPVSTPTPQSQQLNVAMAENVDAQLPKKKAENNVTVNNVVKSSKKDNRQPDMLAELSVRNDEPTLLRMIMGSTRVV